MVKLVLTLCLLGGVALGAEKTAAQRTREVKVALALAEAKPEPVAKMAHVAVSWFEDKACSCCLAGKPCTCKNGECGGSNCPAGCEAKKLVDAKVAKAPTYHYEWQQQCTTDRFGNKRCQLVQVAVQDK